MYTSDSLMSPSSYILTDRVSHRHHFSPRELPHQLFLKRNHRYRSDDCENTTDGASCWVSKVVVLAKHGYEVNHYYFSRSCKPSNLLYDVSHVIHPLEHGAARHGTTVTLKPNHMTPEHWRPAISAKPLHIRGQLYPNYYDNYGLNPRQRRVPSQ